MAIFVTGATGLVGSQLCRELVRGGNEVVALSRSAPPAETSPGMRWVRGDPGERGAWLEEVARAEAVVHLAGESVASGRWSAARKRRLVDSRVESTRLLVDAMGDATGAFVCASAAGYYGARGDEELDEGAAPGHDFLADLCVAWERRALAAKERGVRTVCLRFGVVLSRSGGALGRMLLPFKLGLGGPLGPADRWFPWIHEADAVGLALFALGESISGAVNAVAPTPVRMGEFAKALGGALGRPAILPVPTLALRLALGEMGESLVPGQRVLPRAALEAGYAFRFGALPEALQDLTS